MKDQYFGDINDLFKFDLLQTICKNLNLDGITFVPMLTENDGSTEGSKRNYAAAEAGLDNNKLIDFFKKYSELGSRKTSEIKKYFDSMGVQFAYFSDAYFSHNQRKVYFSKLLERSHTNQFIFFDLDNGLEIKHSNNKHILFDDIKSCLEVIDDKSLICIIQFKPRLKWDVVIERKMKDLKDKGLNHIAYIHNSNIAFFIIAKNKNRLVDIRISLKNYKKTYTSLNPK